MIFPSASNISSLWYALSQTYTKSLTCGTEYTSSYLDAINNAATPYN